MQTYQLNFRAETRISPKIILGIVILLDYLFILGALTGPALATVAVFAFIGNWNNFLSPLIYLRDTDKYTLAIGLQRFQGTHGNVQYHYMMAVATLIVLPVIGVFFLAQRLFVRGIVMTGIKG